MNTKIKIYMQRVNYFLSLSFLLVFSSITNANTLVCMGTNLGDFCLELYDEVAPVTVTNFLEYVNSDDYSNTFFHRSIPGFIVQSGGYTINSELEINKVPSRKAIVNEYQLSNTRGTIAMAKVEGNPDSATNQWFVNLSDNSANLNNQNGGFTVFGRVIDDGMDVIDAISKLDRYNFANVLFDTPTINYDGETALVKDNFVMINKVEQLLEDKNTATFSNNYLLATISLGEYGLYDGKFKLINASPSIEFKLDISLFVKSPAGSVTQSVYNLSDNTLTIPALKLSETIILKDVVLKLTNSDTLTFTLVSIDGQRY